MSKGLEKLNLPALPKYQEFRNPSPPPSSSPHIFHVFHVFQVSHMFHVL